MFTKISFQLNSTILIATEPSSPAPTATPAEIILLPVEQSAEVEPPQKMTIILNVEQPDIILVEKMDDINCLALILNVS